MEDILNEADLLEMNDSLSKIYDKPGQVSKISQFHCAPSFRANSDYNGHVYSPSKGLSPPDNINYFENKVCQNYPEFYGK